MVDMTPNPSWEQNGCQTAQGDRLTTTNLVCVEGVSFSGGSTSLQVTPGASSLQSSVASGGAFIQGDDVSCQGMYSVRSCAAATVTHAAGGASDRWDLIIARVYDSQYVGAADKWTIEIVQGTTTSDPAVPNGAVVLARVLITAGLNSTIPSGNYDDRRREYTACGGENSPQQVINYTASGTFVKANYPGASFIRVRSVGGGGAGGGVIASSSTQVGAAGGGGSGTYGEIILAVSTLAASETITIGAGGTAASAGGAGGNGGASSFGAWLSTPGGSGAASAGVSVATNSQPGGAGGGAATGTASPILSVPGKPGSQGEWVTVPGAFGGEGGSNPLGAGGTRVGPGRVASNNGTGYGSGSSGSSNGSVSTASIGSVAGNSGIIIVEIIG